MDKSIKLIIFVIINLIFDYGKGFKDFRFAQ
jgi:hypothetical protein